MFASTIERDTWTSEKENFLSAQLYHDGLLLPSKIDFWGHLTDPAVSKTILPSNKHIWWGIMAA